MRKLLSKMWIALVLMMFGLTRSAQAGWFFDDRDDGKSDKASIM
jgi:hypothetical protein